MSLRADYARLLLEPSDIVEHLPRFATLASKSQKIIELGTRTGVSTIAFLFGLEKSGGHLWSVDIDAKPAIGDHAAWTFIQGDDTASEVLAQLPHDVDVVFIDTSHRYEHTLTELSLYRPFVKPGGRMLLHDTGIQWFIDAYDDPPFPVGRAIDDYCTAEGLTWTNNPACWGLGEIEV